MRRTPALVCTAAVGTLLAAALTACAPSPNDASACTPVFAAGDASALVAASGAVGSAPSVDFPSPLVVDAPERTVLVEGEGLVATTGMTVDFNATIVDAESGTTVLQTDYSQTGVRYLAGVSTTTQDGEVGSLAQALVCAQPGQRIAVASTVADTGLDLSSVGLAADASVVFVADVQSVFPGKADGLNQIPPDGLPTVVTEPDGTPGITVPDAAAPESTRIATIKAGSGAELAEGDLVVVQVASWVWPAAGEEAVRVSTTWTSTPSTLPLVADPSTQQGVPPGVHRAMLGAKVGSQLLAVVAPDDSFADGAWPSGTQAGDTLIYVIDILGVQASADDSK